MGLSIGWRGSLISRDSFGSILLEGNSTLLDSAKPCVPCQHCSFSVDVFYFNILARFYLSHKSVCASSVAAESKCNYFVFCSQNIFCLVQKLTVFGASFGIF